MFEDHEVTDIRRIPNIRVLVARGPAADVFPAVTEKSPNIVDGGITFLADKKKILFGTQNETIHLWDSQSQKFIRSRSLSEAQTSVSFRGGVVDKSGHYYTTVSEAGVKFLAPEIQ